MGGGKTETRGALRAGRPALVERQRLQAKFERDMRALRERQARKKLLQVAGSTPKRQPRRRSSRSASRYYVCTGNVSWGL